MTNEPLVRAWHYQNGKRVLLKTRLSEAQRLGLEIEGASAPAESQDAPAKNKKRTTRSKNA